MDLMLVNYIVGTMLIILIGGILNRLRGTGVLYSFCSIKIWKDKHIELKLVWNHIYGLYFALIVGYLNISINPGIDNFIYASLATFILYLAGESKGWGEWVGALCNYDTHKMDEKWLLKQYEDKEGKGFPFIFAIANFFIKEKIEGEAVSLNKRISHYLKHATLALILRGYFWYTLLFLTPYLLGLLSLYEYVSLITFLSISFPIACYLGKISNVPKGKFFILEYSRGWHMQEIYNGIFQGIATACLIFTNL